jgi:hypothetical protein
MFWLNVTSETADIGNVGVEAFTALVIIRTVWGYEPVCRIYSASCEFIRFPYKYLTNLKLCKSVHHHTIQINQLTRCNDLSSLLLDVYLQLNMFRASSRPSSGAQQLQ